MIKTPVLAAVNKQIQHEQSNAHAYKAASIYFERVNLHGLEAFMARQSQEEQMHADKLIEHVCDRGGHVELGAISAPRTSFESPLEAAKFVRDLERSTTEQIHRLYELAGKEGDYALQVLLHWYITEQVEEEKWSGELLALVEQFQEDPAQLFMLDHEWGKRGQIPSPQDRRGV
jgi:ferritin